VKGAPRNQLQLLQVGRTTDQRRARCDGEDGGPPEQCQGPDRLGLAAHLDGHHGSEVEPAADTAYRSLTAEDAPGFRGLLQSGGHIDGIAAEREVTGCALPRSDHLTGVDPQANG